MEMSVTHRSVHRRLHSIPIIQNFQPMEPRTVITLPKLLEKIHGRDDLSTRCIPMTKNDKLSPGGIDELSEERG